jgi:hypothetical protein
VVGQNPRAAGLNDLNIHDLRRTTASWLAIKGENLAVIARVLNHTSLANTAIYTRLNLAPVVRSLSACRHGVRDGAATPQRIAPEQSVAKGDARMRVLFLSSTIAIAILVAVTRYAHPIQVPLRAISERDSSVTV